MIQFTRTEMENLRKKSARYAEAVEKLKVAAAEVFEGEIMVPKTGIANWTLYYYCPDCSVQLRFDRTSPQKHICPCCGKTFDGEPYDGAWWGLMNAQNYNAVFQMAMIWLATGEEAYAKKAIAILKEYARYYPDYEVHGDIPYNGPGRSGAQTLDEANFQRTFAMAYDILSECMTQEEKDFVRDNMFLPGAEFLLAHRHKQLHNHEVITNSAIAVIGILFDKPEMTETALYEDYGILYQLEHGMQDNGMWFEGSFGYHFYALQSFYAFEKFALHTKYSNIHHPNYKKMMELLSDYLEPDNGIPLMNDTNYAHTSDLKLHYEFPYRELGGERMADILTGYYQDRERDSLEAFLYGADAIANISLPKKNYHTQVGRPGHTVLRGKDGRYLLFKHDRYGGEHDHYDRLGISFLAYGKRIAPDLGTTGYGALMHYDYYKNTGSHNTIVLGEENQAPVNAVLTRYEEKDDVVYVEAEADWTAPYEMPDSFTIVQWSEENYRPVTMKRKIAWTDTYFAEVMTAENVPEQLTADWVMHFSGKPVQNGEEQTRLPDGYFTKKPFKHLHDCKAVAATGSYRRTYQDEDVYTTVYGMNNGQTLITASGPDNPSSREVSYLIERRQGGAVVCAHVIESHKGEAQLAEVSFTQDEQEIRIHITTKNKEKKVISFSIS